MSTKTKQVKEEKIGFSIGEFLFYADTREMHIKKLEVVSHGACYSPLSPVKVTLKDMSTRRLIHTYLYPRTGKNCTKNALHETEKSAMKSIADSLKNCTKNALHETEKSAMKSIADSLKYEVKRGKERVKRETTSLRNHEKKLKSFQAKVK